MFFSLRLGNNTRHGLLELIDSSFPKIVPRSDSTIWPTHLGEFNSSGDGRCTEMGGLFFK